MGHEWVFEVLRDLADYADRNGMPRLARKAEEALATAREEIAEEQRKAEGGGRKG